MAIYTKTQDNEKAHKTYVYFAGLNNEAFSVFTDVVAAYEKLDLLDFENGKAVRRSDIHSLHKSDVEALTGIRQCTLQKYLQEVLDKKMPLKRLTKNSAKIKKLDNMKHFLEKKISESAALLQSKIMLFW